VTRFWGSRDEWDVEALRTEGTTMPNSMPGGDMADMVKALAALPEPARNEMVRDRLEGFAALGEEQRRAAMRRMIEAVLALPDDARRALVGTRTSVLLDLDEATRMRLMGSHMAVLRSLGSGAMMREMTTIESIIPDLPAAKRQAVRMMLDQMRTGEVAMAPRASATSAAARTSAPEPPQRKPWWKFWE
jgi:hypothetical protein